MKKTPLKSENATPAAPLAKQDLEITAVQPKKTRTKDKVSKIPATVVAELAQTTEPVGDTLSTEPKIKKRSAKKAANETIPELVSEVNQPVTATQDVKVKQPSTETKTLSIKVRIGLTAGDIWQYLSKNGSTTISKIVQELPEEEKIIQRSIGWLAQEGKITLNTQVKGELISLVD